MSNSPKPTSAPPPASSATWWLLTTVAVVAAAIVFASFLRPSSSLPRMADGSALIGTPLPELKVSGWINGPGPTNADLVGKVVVVDAWAFWCGPCRRIAPALKSLHAKYGPQGAQFVGLTSEGDNVLPHSQRFIEEEQIPWPQGYGAFSPLRALEADSIPRIWIFGRDGKMVWDMSSSQSFEKVIEAALAQPAPLAAANDGKP